MMAWGGAAEQLVANVETVDGHGLVGFESVRFKVQYLTWPLLAGRVR
jgi:uncharacterized protein (UPF0333 family)